jgi:hypothetical protein
VRGAEEKGSGDISEIILNPFFLSYCLLKVISLDPCEILDQPPTWQKQRQNPSHGSSMPLPCSPLAI